MQASSIQRGYDYRLTQKSPAIDRGVDLSGESAKLVPTDEYVHPLKSQPRKKNGPLDIGAYEYVGVVRGTARASGRAGPGRGAVGTVPGR